MGSSFVKSVVSFKDTKGCGGITVRGIELETDAQGFIDGPPDLEADIAPHGFVRQDRPAQQPDPQQRRR